VTKSNETLIEAVSEIQNSLNNAFGDLSVTIKALGAQVAELQKSLGLVSREVDSVKGNFSEFGKRVDKVEADTAFRKSGDLGEIVQELPEMRVQKSLWGGRFLTNTDLFN
jgi:peptidoglycan hydrolase CwlO-like protein